MKIRIKFSKEGTLRFVGHLDIMRYFQKAVRRAGIPIRYSEGYSPHQIMSFAAPLGMCVTGTGEYMDIETKDEEQLLLSSAECMRRLNAEMAEGMKILSYRQIPKETENAMASVFSADYRVEFSDETDSRFTEILSGEIEKFMKEDSVTAVKEGKNGPKEFDIRSMVHELKAEDRTMTMNISQGSTANLKPQALIAYFSELESLRDFKIMSGIRIIRTELYDINHKRLDEYGEEIS